MHVRAVRFTDVSAERIEALVARIDASEGPPPGVPATGLDLLYDESQRTAVVLQYFETAEDMGQEPRRSAPWTPPKRRARAPLSICAS